MSVLRIRNADGTFTEVPGLQGPQGPAGKDGLTTSIQVNGNTYTHSNGTITLPNYPTVVSAANGITIEDAAGNFTATNVEGALAELFQSVSNGKTLIASAITDMGVTTLATDTFEQMANNIRQITTGGGGSGDTNTYTSQFASALYNATTWQVFGDSISTTYNITEGQIWHNLITVDSEFSSMTKYNNSLTGSEVSDGGRDIASFVERYTSLNSNADLVTIFGGVNDWGHNNIPLGNYDDVTTSQSFYGALNTLLPGVKTQCPNARVIWLSPLKTRSNMAVEHTNADGTNTLGLRLTDYIQAIKYKCHQYNIEFVDLYGVTGLDPDTNTSNFQSDGLHPTASGQAALRDYLLNVATVSVPTDEYINEIGTDVKFPAVATFNSLVNRNTAYFCVVVDVSNLKDGDSVVASWTGSEASVWNNSFNNSADPWYCTESELRNVTGTNDSRIKASGSLTKLTGDLLSGTSTTIIKSPGANYKYLRIQVPINNPHLPGTWTISNMTVTVNGTTNLPILNIGGFFVNSDIVITH